jgi:hypothetical protein
MITKSDVSEELKSSFSTFEIAMPAFNMAILSLLYQMDIAAATTTIQYFYKITLALTLTGILVLPFYSLRYWSQSRLKLLAFNTAEKHADQLLDMGERNDTTSKLCDYMSATDTWSQKLHLLDVKITTWLIYILVPVFFLDTVSFVVLTYLLKM